MPKIVDHDAKREEFVIATIEVIASEGLTGATMRRVADQAGCTTGSLTNYFCCRDELLIATLNHVHNAQFSRVNKIMESDDSNYDKLENVLLTVMPLNNNSMKEWKVWLAFWSASHGSQQLAKVNEEKYSEINECLTSLLSPLVKRKKDLHSEVYLINAMTDGLILGLTLSASGPKKLKEEQKECAKQLKIYLSKYK